MYHNTDKQNHIIIFESSKLKPLNAIFPYTKLKMMQRICTQRAKKNTACKLVWQLLYIYFAMLQFYFYDEWLCKRKYKFWT